MKSTLKAKIKLALAAMTLLTALESKAQLIFITTPDTTICSGPITLNVQAVVGQLTSITTDDNYCPAPPAPLAIGFSFTFFGNIYTQCVVASNGIISFNTALAGQFCPWFIPGPIPNAAANLANAVMCPWQDLFPPSGGTTRFGTVGTAPNRKFVYEFCSMPYFTTGICPNMFYTGEAVLFETTNIIEIHILNKPFCAAWNGGKAVEGIQNSTGTIAFTAPGRNATQWTAVNDGYRWTPTGPASYNVTAIPYAPIAVVTSVTWYANSTASAPIGVGNSITVNPVVTTSYIAVGSIAGGCSAISTYQDTVVVTIVPGYNVTLTPVNILCNGDATGQITAAATGGGQPPFHYLWSTSPNDTLNILSNLPIGTYTVTITDSVGCRATASVTLTEPPLLVVTPDPPTDVSCNGLSDGIASVTVSGGVPPYTYLWSNAAVTNPNSNVPANTYTVIVTDANGCTKTATVVVAEPPLLVINPSVSQTICIGTTVNLAANASGGTPPYIYQWSDLTSGATDVVSPIVTTTYTVTVTDANGCSITSPAIVITVNAPLNVVAVGNASICDGTTIQVSASGTGGDPNTYLFTWNPNVGTGTGPFSDTPNTTTTYTVTLTDGCGTPSSASSVVVTVNPTPVVSFTATPTYGCVPLTSCFTTTILTGTINLWDWDFGDMTPHGNTQNPCHVYATASAPLLYSVTVTVTTGAGCSQSYSMPNYIQANPITVAAFAASPKITTLADPEISFYDQSSGVQSWAWNFGDGFSDTLQNPTHTYLDTGYFQVCQIVTNQYFCSDTACDSVHIRPDFSFYVPNAFTPNGDMVNELFTPMGRSFKDYDLIIYDRWGLVIFRSKDIFFSWDGKLSSGKDAPIGIYVYTINLKDLNDLKHNFIGSVALIR